MNKKKIVALIMVAALAMTTLIGGTLAYFTDEDEATNTFTMGNVKIELEETFDKENAELVPGVDIQKEVKVKNTGHNDAYVRVHIAIPKAVDDGDPRFEASKNFLHWNFEWAVTAAGKWTWFNTDTPADVPYENYPGYPGTGNEEWNFYETEIEDVVYNVYVVTYNTPIASGSETEAVINKVYLDTTVDNEYLTDDDGEINAIKFSDNKGNTITLDAIVDEDGNVSVDGKALDILVFAEGVQKETFTSAIEALNKAFGVPSPTNNPWFVPAA